MYFEKIFQDFKTYITTFAPYNHFQDKLLAYFVNDKQTGFKSRELAWYNSVSNRYRFNCGYRLSINVYRNCSHGCRYCYVNGYSKGIAQGVKKSGLVKKIGRDLADFRQIGLPPCPVHLSISTDPLQEDLELKHRDTFETLIMLKNNKDLLSEIIILTKNPLLLLNQEYSNILGKMTDKAIIEITVPFYRENYLQYEPNAPHPKDRLKALQELVKSGLTVRLRLDPLFPRESGVQTEEDIYSIINDSKGVQCVITNQLRLVKPKKTNTVPEVHAFYDEMKQYYEGGKKNGVEWHGTRYAYAGERAGKELEIVKKVCQELDMTLVHCKKSVLVDDEGIPLIKKILEKKS